MRTDGRKAAGKSTVYQNTVTANVECSQDNDAVWLEDCKEDFNNNDINVSVCSQGLYNGPPSKAIVNSIT